MRRNNAGTFGRDRRGVTLLEMLVTVALLVLVMTILVAIFRSALGAITAQQAYDQIDQGLRRLDQTLRNDLDGCTARFTPPLNPADNLGYFEYIENAHADYQGEDTDDILCFTAKAPEGQPFTGRIWIANNDYTNLTVATTGAIQTITSDYAEIIYFLRNGNLYRRILLIAPQRRSSIAVGPSTGSSPSPGMYPSGVNALGLGLPVGWQGLNDISVHPDPTGIGNASFNTNTGPQTFASLNLPNVGIPIPNTLGDLTNRQNRFARPRFYNDYFTLNGYTGSGSIAPPDFIPDDMNIDNVSGAVFQDGVNDYSPTLYPNLFLQPGNSGYSAIIYNPYTGTYLNSGHAITFPLVYEPSGSPTTGMSNSTRIVNYDTMAFPYIYPGMYSKMPGGGNPMFGANHPAIGAHHALDPSGATIAAIQSAYGTVTDNHAPLLGGIASGALTYTPPGPDSLPTPLASNANSLSTWWGMPTWRETLSPSWTDPVLRMNILGGTDIGTGYKNNQFAQNAGLSPTNPVPLPKMNGYLNVGTSDPDLVYLPFQDQPFNDGVGNDGSASVNFATPPTVWQDDLILTGVRSFDVKAYDNNPVFYDNQGNQIFNPPSPPAGYFDLGYEADSPGGTTTGTPVFALGTFAHEGRIPPLPADNRVDPQNPYMSVLTGQTLGDSGTGVIRLTRTWDTWSTDYSFAPGLPLNPIDRYLTNYTGTTPAYPIAQTIPTYPSYPPPYPAPLRGIQINIRATDPRGQYIKSITIRQDFTDKL